MECFNPLCNGKEEDLELLKEEKVKFIYKCKLCGCEFSETKVKIEL